MLFNYCFVLNVLFPKTHVPSNTCVAVAIETGALCVICKLTFLGAVVVVCT